MHMHVLILETLNYRDRKTFIRLYQVFVLPHLCYSVSALAPYTVDDKEVLEKVQRREVMMVTTLRCSFEERLATLGMRTLEARRSRGELIETYNILSGKSDASVQTWFNLAQDKEYAVRTKAQLDTST